MLEDYIKESWSRLKRHALDVALDPKVSGDAHSYLYIPRGEDPDAIARMIAARRTPDENTGAIEVRVVPDDLTVKEDHGILYLPHDYIVPGGRFNEMYGWDSAWIIFGLLRDGRSECARGMIENFIYEIRNYGGKVLNANRTYYLSRSQPPMLAVMAQAVLPWVKEDERADYLRRVADAIALEYEGFWKAHRFDPEWGLFRYGHIDQGLLGLCPEVSFGERDEKGWSHYEKIAAYLRELPADHYLRARFYDEEKSQLSQEAIAGDRAMRESGFDASLHMGYYGMETMDFSPICLNSLLYVQCRLVAEMYKELGEVERCRAFDREANDLRASIQKYLWDDEAKLFFNYNHHYDQHSTFLFITSVYPLWAGIATPSQAQSFRDNLPRFETPYGLTTTDRQTGCQWDAPFMWAPMVYFTVMGLHRYGFTRDAQRIAHKFIATVRRVYKDTGANFEKYNADSGGKRTKGIIDVGYPENVVGFGWTNGAVLEIQGWLKSVGKTSAGKASAKKASANPDPAPEPEQAVSQPSFQ